MASEFILQVACKTSCKDSVRTLPPDSVRIKLFYVRMLARLCDNSMRVLSVFYRRL